MHRNLLLTTLTLLITNTIAQADNRIKPGKVELYPTYAAVGIEAAYSDDDNGNAQASFTWRKAGEANWHNGVDMTFDRKRKLIWASIWPLEQGDAIEVKITFDDADDPDLKRKPWEGKVATRKFNFAPVGNTLHVSPAGDDANPGTKEKPYKTFSHAGKKLQAGDTLLVHDGIYPEGNLFIGLKGTEAKPIMIAAAPGAKPVIDSSFVIAKGDAGWKNSGDGVFAIAVPGFANYVAQDGLRMFAYPTLDELKADKLKTKRAYFYDAKAKQLHLRTGTGKPADAHVFNVAQQAYALHLSGAKHVVIRGLTMRYNGSAAVRLSEGATGCVLYENTIHNSPGAIFMKTETTRDNAIWKNEIFERGAADFSWTAHYAIGYANQAIYCDKAGRGNSFCHNAIHGYFDLISVESWKNVEKIQYNRDCDIMFNALYNASDDAIEADGGGVNMRIHGNTIRNCRTALSLAPIERGPVYVTRNTATFFGLFIKFNVGGTVSHGWTYIYHNTGYSLSRGEDGGTGISFAPTLPCTNKIFKNNIVIVNEWCVRAWRPDNVLDYNCYFNIPDRAPRRFQAGKTSYNTIALFAKGVGQETHGLYADPLLVETSDAGKYATPALDTPFSALLTPSVKTGDLRVRPGSPCIDRGVALRGINDDFRGKAPDIGAFESDK